MDDQVAAAPRAGTPWMDDQVVAAPHRPHSQLPGSTPSCSLVFLPQGSFLEWGAVLGCHADLLGAYRDLTTDRAAASANEGDDDAAGTSNQPARTKRARHGQQAPSPDPVTPVQPPPASRRGGTDLSDRLSLGTSSDGEQEQEQPGRDDMQQPQHDHDGDGEHSGGARRRLFSSEAGGDSAGFFDGAGGGDSSMLALGASLGQSRGNGAAFGEAAAAGGVKHRQLAKPGL